MADYPENPGPLHAPALKNKSGGGKGPLGRPDFCSKDPELVKHLQKMLVTLGYDLGTSGPEKEGVDGSFGELTETAVKDFQDKNLDWDANQLEVDGRVGPRTSDALNRAMVGKWYDCYQTPGELAENKQLHTVTSEFLTKGLSIKPDTSHKARILLVDNIEVAQDLKLLLGIEVAPRGDVKTRGLFDIGTPGKGYDPLDGFSSFLYLFSWDDIPGNDNVSLIEFLKQNFGIDWVETAKIEKIHNGTTIKVSNQKKYILLNLNYEQTEVILKIGDVRTDNLIVKIEKGKLNIYSFFIGKQDGDIHSTFLELGYLNGKAVRIEAGKSKVLETYDEKTGKTTFKDSIYPTEEMVATIHIFKGYKCLTGDTTFEDVKKQMTPTKTGMNQILVRLKKNSSSIQDCIIDGVVYVAEGQQKVRMAR